jgi:HlyD family type I secretion membrane fusion protein
MKHADSKMKSKYIDDSRYRRLGWATLALTFVVMFSWSALATLDSAVVANGRVHVASLNKSVQHLDGGLVKTIAVKDGDQVLEGQLLLSLDRKPLEIKLGNISDQLIETDASLERLAAERDMLTKLDFSPALDTLAKKKKATPTLETQLQLFDSRRKTLSSEQAILRQRLLKTEQEIKGKRKINKTLKTRVSLLNQDLAGLHKLVAKKLASQAKLREVQRQVNELQGDLISNQAEVERLESSLPEIRSEIELLEREYRKEAITNLRELQAHRINLLAEQQSLEERLSRVDIRAPVSGKIKGLNVVTRGAVIREATTIMEIVPLERGFRIHAQISPLDIDSLQPGLKAEVRIPAFESARYFPSLYADLEDISTDVYLEERSGESYYKATMRVDDESLAVLEQENLKLVSGMPIEVVIKTGERTLLDYLLKPMREMVIRAFNEA